MCIHRTLDSLTPLLFSLLLSLDSSDHNSILTALNLFPPSIMPLRWKVWLYSRASFDAINSDLVHAISSMDPQVDVNSAWNRFHNTFLSVLSNHIPNKILTTRKSLPWITYHLQLQLHKWDKAYGKAKRTNSTTDWAVYRRLRNKGESEPSWRIFPLTCGRQNNFGLPIIHYLLTINKFLHY